MTDPAALRDRLLALRDDALSQLAAANTIDPGLLRIGPDIGAVLAVLDAVPADVMQSTRRR